ncbi:hypothetical protein RRG08_032972 [Elysia crispata]|uniref:Uncharacterized protein n=1 Tax=Elysia crispata TaxID=231223 RepID=A0AAE0YRP9_9GAST|nr:hypothetical protein RRG08_032972 [Elysia crispata]
MPEKFQEACRAARSVMTVKDCVPLPVGNDVRCLTGAPLHGAALGEGRCGPNLSQFEDEFYLMLQELLRRKIPGRAPLVEGSFDGHQWASSHRSSGCVRPTRNGASDKYKTKRATIPPSEVLGETGQLERRRHISPRLATHMAGCSRTPSQISDSIKWRDTFGVVNFLTLKVSHFPVRSHGAGRRVQFPCPRGDNVTSAQCTGIWRVQQASELSALAHRLIIVLDVEPPSVT